MHRVTRVARHGLLVNPPHRATAVHLSSASLAVDSGVVSARTASEVRLRLDVAYDGAGFAGWSRQPGLRTVQGELEAALALVLREPEGSIRLTVAGRTDAGVHALGQVAHVDLSAEQWMLVQSTRRSEPHEQALGAEASLVRRLNGIAGRAADLVVRDVAVAPAAFDARFSALWRRYEYRIADAEAQRDPRRRGHTWWHTGALDLEAMRAASAPLTGLHDFAAFCKPREGATTIRTLHDYEWRRDDDGVLIATVRADAFCHSMVRALVGAAVAVGLGRLDAGRLVDIRDDATRTNDFPVAPAHGLTLVEVGYPAVEQFAARAEQTRARRDAERAEDTERARGREAAQIDPLASVD